MHFGMRHFDSCPLIWDVDEWIPNACWNVTPEMTYIHPIWDMYQTPDLRCAILNCAFRLEHKRCVSSTQFLGERSCMFAFRLPIQMLAFRFGKWIVQCSLGCHILTLFVLLRTFIGNEFGVAHPESCRLICDVDPHIQFGCHIYSWILRQVTPTFISRDVPKHI